MKISTTETNSIIRNLTALPLARMIYSREVNPQTISEQELRTLLATFGEDHDNAFEIYVENAASEICLVEHCIKQNRLPSAIVLLFTLLEGELNTLLRMHLRIRGFSSVAISDALKGTDFDTKMTVLLPLLGVPTHERLKNTAVQCKSIRNLVVHNKSTPNLSSLSGEKKVTETSQRRNLRDFLPITP